MSKKEGEKKTFDELDGQEILANGKSGKDGEEKKDMDDDKEWIYYERYLKQQYGEDEEEALEDIFRMPSDLGIDEIPLDYISDIELEEELEEEETIIEEEISEKDTMEQLDATSLLKGVSQVHIRREMAVVVEGEGHPDLDEEPDASVLQLFEKKETGDVDFGVQAMDEIADVSTEEEEILHMPIVEEEEEVAKTISEVEVPLDRDALIEEYKSMVNERYIIRRRNYLLKRRLAEHFKRRHMEHAYKEAYTPADLEDRYERKLIAFRELDDETNETKRMIDEQVEELTVQKIRAKEETKEKFEALLANELEIGLMICQQSVLNESTVKMLINNKRTKAWQLSKIRFASIKFKEKIKEAENRRLALEIIGPNLRLLDYEEMQIEFNNFMDKIDERIEQMVRLRAKVQGDVQIMAHMRERHFAQTDDILDLKKSLMYANSEIIDLRKTVNRMVRIREDHRYQTLALKDESGLLTYNLLLKDFQNTLNEIDRVAIDLALIQQIYNEDNPILRAGRLAIDALKMGQQIDFKAEEESENNHSSLNEESLVKMISGYSNLLPSFDFK